MFVLWMFGSELESIWGRRSFLKYYFFTGVGSGLLWLILNLSNANYVLAGASGAVYGILLAFGMMFPNRTVYIYFLLPIKVKYLVMILVATEFILSMNSTSDISHITHLSAVLIGYIYLRYFWRIKDIKFSIRKYFTELSYTIKNKNEEKRVKLQQEVDHILDKINKVGYEALSKEEKDTLYASSRKLYQTREKDWFIEKDETGLIYKIHKTFQVDHEPLDYLQLDGFAVILVSGLEASPLIVMPLLPKSISTNNG